MDDIERLQRKCADARGLLSLAGGLPDMSIVPTTMLARATARALERGEADALQYGWPEGQIAVRRFIAQRLTAQGTPTDEANVIVTAGAQQALSIALGVLTHEHEHARVAVNDETYPGALDLIRARGLEATYDPRCADVAYVVDGIGNPRGRPLSAARRALLADASCPLIVDRVYAELQFDGAVAPCVLGHRRDRVWQVGSFSKTLSPGLRVGWLVPPQERHDEALATKHDADLQASGLSQAILGELFSELDFDEHLAQSRAHYRRRADCLMRAMRRELPAWRFVEPQGGFSIFAESPFDGDERELLVQAAREGTSFDPGRMFRRDPRDRPLSMRLSFSNLDEESIVEAVHRLARACHTVLGTTARLRARVVYDPTG